MLKASELTIEYLKSLVGNSLNEHTFNVDNGCTVMVRTKITKRCGVISAAYLHLWIYKDGKLLQHWREHKDGKFRTI